MTYTLVQMPVARSTFEEIKGKLTKAGYEHAIRDVGLDMNGIALVAEVPPKDPPEIVQSQLRTILRQQCQDMAVKHISPNLPPGVCFLLFLADVGERGSLAYMANCTRDSANAMILNHLKMQGENVDAIALREQLDSLSTFLAALAATAGWPMDQPLDPSALLELVKKQREAAAKEKS